MKADRSTTKTWLVTGSSRGLGRHLVEAVLHRGDRVLATARHPADLEALAGKYVDRIRVRSLDVGDPTAARAAVQSAVDEFGTLDVVVNNAGYANSAGVEDGTDEDFRAQVETNLFGVVNVTRAALPVLRRQRSGHIIQISSIVGRVGALPGFSAYTAAKFAVEGFSEVLRDEVKPFGIAVTVVEPGGMRTEWSGTSMSFADVSEDYRDTVGRTNEMIVAGRGKQTGDPVRAADIIAGLPDRPDRPFRLLLTAPAITRARRAAADWSAEIERWAELGESIDYAIPARERR